MNLASASIIKTIISGLCLFSVIAGAQVQTGGSVFLVDQNFNIDLNGSPVYFQSGQSGTGQANHLLADVRHTWGIQLVEVSTLDHVPLHFDRSFTIGSSDSVNLNAQRHIYIYNNHARSRRVTFILYQPARPDLEYRMQELANVYFFNNDVIVNSSQGVNSGDQWSARDPFSNKTLNQDSEHFNRDDSAFASFFDLVEKRQREKSQTQELNFESLEKIEKPVAPPRQASLPQTKPVDFQCLPDLPYLQGLLRRDSSADCIRLAPDPANGMHFAFVPRYYGGISASVFFSDHTGQNWPTRRNSVGRANSDGWGANITYSFHDPTHSINISFGAPDESQAASFERAARLWSDYLRAYSKRREGSAEHTNQQPVEFEYRRTFGDPTLPSDGQPKEKYPILGQPYE